MQQLQEALKDKEGTIETLERQLVQAGIKGKVMQAAVEINKKKEEVKSGLTKAGVVTNAKIDKELLKTQAVMDTVKGKAANDSRLFNARAGDVLQNLKNNLEVSEESE